MTEDFIGLDGSSGKGPRESITISLSGELLGSDQHLCCANWIGCTSWVLDMMHRPSTLTRSNHSRKGAKPSFHFGCRRRWRRSQKSVRLRRIRSQTEQPRRRLSPLIQHPREYFRSSPSTIRAADMWSFPTPAAGFYAFLVVMREDDRYLAPKTRLDRRARWHGLNRHTPRLHGLGRLKSKGRGVPDRTLQGAFGLYPFKVFRRVLACSP